MNKVATMAIPKENNNKTRDHQAMGRPPALRIKSKTKRFQITGAIKTAEAPHAPKKTYQDAVELVKPDTQDIVAKRKYIFDTLAPRTLI